MSVQLKGSGTIGGLDEGLVVSGIVTSSTQINVGSNIKLGNAGVITATSFVGSGANLTSLPAQATIANNADNRIITGGSGVNLNGEANLTFNGGATGDAQLTVHAAEANANSDSELILETSNDFATSVIMFKDSTAEAGSIAYNHGDNYIKLSTNGTNGGTERLRIDSSGNVTIYTGNLTIPDSIIHSGDTDTKIAFTDNQIDLQCAGASRAYINNYALYIKSGFPLAFLASSGATPNIKSGGTNNQDLLFTTGSGNPTRVQITSDGNLKFNSGYGSVATAYGVRAWMRYRGDTNALDGSANVSSVTDHSTGSFSMNFTTAMVDANYAVIGEVGYNDTSLNIGITHSGTHSAPTTTSMRFSVGLNYNSNLSDERYISIAIVR